MPHAQRESSPEPQSGPEGGLDLDLDLDAPTDPEGLLDLDLDLSGPDQPSNGAPKASEQGAELSMELQHELLQRLRASVGAYLKVPDKPGEYAIFARTDGTRAILLTDEGHQVVSPLYKLLIFNFAHHQSGDAWPLPAKLEAHLKTYGAFSGPYSAIDATGTFRNDIRLLSINGRNVRVTQEDGRLFTVDAAQFLALNPAPKSSPL